ncbi:DNA repair protein RecO [bacterium]|nr:DNA repair protein RecO [bacterium]
MTTISRPVISSEAMVLRVWPTGETSVIASLLTEETGFVKVIAKGARNSKSNLRSLVQPGTIVDIEYTVVEGRDLQYLRGGSASPGASKASLTLEKTAYLLAIVEIIDRCKPTGKDADLFHLCRRFMEVLSSLPSSVNASAYYRFLLELLNMQGLAPTLNRCSNCRSEILNDRAVVHFFSYSSGGIVCADCLDTGKAGRELTPPVYSNLRKLLEQGIDTGPPVARQVDRETGIVLHRFLEYHLPDYRLPTALDMLKVCKTNKES